MYDFGRKDTGLVQFRKIEMEVVTWNLGENSYRVAGKGLYFKHERTVQS